MAGFIKNNGQLNYQNAFFQKEQQGMNYLQ